MIRLAVVAVLGLAGCSSVPPTVALLNADRAFAAVAIQKGPAEAFYQFTTDDALQLPATGKPLVGRAAIRDAMSEGPPLLLNWQPQFAEVARDEDLGWTWGEWQGYQPGAGGKRVAQGKYVNIWKKQDDGSWKVRLDLGNVERNPAP